MQNSTQVADYIGGMCSELAELASTSRLPVLQHLLKMAALEACPPDAASALNGRSRHPRVGAREKFNATNLSGHDHARMLRG
jgi:hypothetical protein